MAAFNSDQRRDFPLPVRGLNSRRRGRKRKIFTVLTDDVRANRINHLQRPMRRRLVICVGRRHVSRKEHRTHATLPQTWNISVPLRSPYPNVETRHRAARDIVVRVDQDDRFLHLTHHRVSHFSVLLPN